MAHHNHNDDIESFQHLEGWVELTSAGSGKALLELEKRVREAVQGEFDEKELQDLCYALREVCDNAVEWGNQNDENRKIRVSYCVFEGEFVLKVQDEGEGFDANTIPDPARDPLAVMLNRKQTGKRPGGFGIHMVKKMMDRVMYSDKGNVVLLAKNLRKGGEEKKSPFA